MKKFLKLKISIIIFVVLMLISNFCYADLIGPDGRFDEPTWYEPDINSNKIEVLGIETTKPILIGGLTAISLVAIGTIVLTNNKRENNNKNDEEKNNNN